MLPLVYLRTLYLVNPVTQPAGNLGSGGKALNPTTSRGVIRGKCISYLYLSFTSLRNSILH